MPSDPSQSRPPTPRPGDDEPRVSDPKKLQRPGSVTWSMAVLIGMGFLVVVSIFDRVRNLRSVATRDAVTEYLSTPPGAGLGLDVESVLQAVHIASVACATLAAAAGVLACWLPTRQRHVRLGLTVLAPPLLLTGIVADGLGAALMVAAIVVLWMPQARDWYAGRAPAPANANPPRPSRGPDTPAVPPSPVLPPPSRPGAPAPAPMSQERATQPTSAPQQPWPALPPHPGAHPGYPAPYQGAWPAQPRPRPAHLVLAAMLTWLFSGLAFLLGTTALIAVRGAPQTVLDEWTAQQQTMPNAPVLSNDTVITMLTVVCVAMLVVSVAAIVFAAFAFAQRRWASYALTVLSVVIGVFCLIAAIGSYGLVVPALAAFTVAALLRQRVVRDWLDQRYPS